MSIVKNENPKLVYLACPYSWSPDRAFKACNEVAAQLMMSGDVVFSPISHSHPIADYMPESLRTDHEFWMYQDLKILGFCEEVVVIDFGLRKIIQDSAGVQEELTYAKMLGIPIRYLQYPLSSSSSQE